MAGGTGTQPTPNSVLLPGSTRVSGRASALLGVAGPSLATHRPLLCGGPTYYGWAAVGIQEETWLGELLPYVP